MDKTKKEGNMKKLKILAVVLALGALCMGVLSGCDNGKNGSETGEGTFYTLQKAYDEGYLTKEEIMSIAYYHNGGRVYNEEIMSEEYTPIPKTPQELSEETVNKIKENAAYEYNSEHNHETKATADGFTIVHYYGTYDGAVAVIVTHSYLGDSPAVVVDNSYSVAGVIFHYWTYNHIQIYIEK